MSGQTVRPRRAARLRRPVYAAGSDWCSHQRPITRSRIASSFVLEIWKHMRANGESEMDQLLPIFWNLPAPQVLEQLGSAPQGLSTAQAQAALARYGPNTFRSTRRLSGLRLLLKQFQSPITLILIGAATLSLFLGDSTNAVMILAIVLVSSVLGFWQERGAANAVAHLLAVVQTKATVLRDAKEANLPFAEIVPGDLVLIEAGATVPGDCLLLES